MDSVTPSCGINPVSFRKSTQKLEMKKQTPPLAEVCYHFDGVVPVICLKQREK